MKEETERIRIREQTIQMKEGTIQMKEETERIRISEQKKARLARSNSGDASSVTP